MSKLIFIFIFLCAASCNMDSSTSAQLNKTPKPEIQSETPKSETRILSELSSDEYPQILYGIFHLRDLRKNMETTLDVNINNETVRETVSRGFDVNLPPVGSTIKMDVMNCAGYLATAYVTYRGLNQEEVWTAELTEETKIRTLNRNYSNVKKIRMMNLRENICRIRFFSSRRRKKKEKKFVM